MTARTRGTNSQKAIMIHICPLLAWLLLTTPPTAPATVLKQVLANTQITLTLMSLYTIVRAYKILQNAFYTNAFDVVRDMSRGQFSVFERRISVSPV